MSERVTNQRLAEIIANLADSTGWFGDIYDGLRELQERRASSPAAGRKEIIEKAAAIADSLADSSGRIQLCAGEMTAQELRTAKAVLKYVSRLIRTLKETPNGN